MKTKITKTIFILGTFFSFMAAKAQYTAIPDVNFENYLYTQGMDNINGDHQVLTVNIAGVTSLNVSSKNISDLTGIQAFSALRNLYCNYNSLPNLDVTALSNLQHLECADNQLTSLNVLGCNAINYIDCQHNQLTSLDVQGLSSLTYLNCQFNVLTSLNITGDNAINSYNVSFNRLTTINVSGRGNLQNFNAQNNLLTSLNISNCPNLSMMFCTGNPTLSCITASFVNPPNNFFWMKDDVASYSLNCNNGGGGESLYTAIPDYDFEYALVLLGIDNILGDHQVLTAAITGITNLDLVGKNIHDMTGIKGFINLQTLACSGNLFSTLDVSGMTHLTYLFANNGQLANLNVANCVLLNYLQCANNQISNLNLSALTQLTHVDCQNNAMSNLNVSQCVALEYLNCQSNSLSSLNASGLIGLKHLDCSFNQLTNLNVSGCTALEVFSCAYNQLITLNLNGLTNITSFYCRDNLLQSLNTTGLVNMTFLDCSNNQISNLNVSGCNLLAQLDCSENLLPNINVNSLSSLSIFDCSTNLLTSLNVSGVTTLTNLDCHFNQISNLNFSGCFNLNFLNCGSNQIASLNVFGYGNLLTLDCRSNLLPSLDVTSLFNLSDLNCSYNSIPTLNLNGLSNLTFLNCSNNALTNLNLSNLSNPYNSFSVLNCSNNSITNLNMTGLHPTKIDCSSNYLTSLNVSQNNYLNYLDCSFNALRNLNVSLTLNAVGEGSHNTLYCNGNPNLTCIITSNPALAEVNPYWHKDATASYATFCATSGPTASTLVLSGSSNICSGSSTDISVAIAGGASPYTVVYNNGISDITINNYTTGAIITVMPENSTTYSLVSVTDANNNLGVGNVGTINITVNPSIRYYADFDHDGYGSFAISQLSCNGAPANYVANSLDCNDNNATIHPGAQEICGDGLDNDCNGVIDEVCLTEIIPTQWNITLANIDAQILAIRNPLAQMYRFEVSNGGVAKVYETTKFNFDLTKVPGTSYATTYSIRVALKIGGIWGVFGNAHNVNSPVLTINKILTTKLLPAFCGSVLAALDTKIGAVPVYGTNGGYRFEITKAGVITVYNSPNYNFRLKDAGIAAYGTAYSIRVAAIINGVCGNYGVSCTVTTPVLTSNVIPTTALLPAVCGTTLATLATKIGTIPVYAATGYRFEIKTGGITTIYDSAYYNFKLSDAGIAAYGTIYTIRVAALINGIYGNYGASCNITTPAAPALRSKAESFEVIAYPNPSTNVFNFKVNGANDETVSILVFDMTGRQVDNKVVNATDVEKLTLGQNYASGVYNVIVSQGMNTKTVRLVKK